MVRDLRKTRQEFDLTLEELSEYTGISIPLLRKWERTVGWGIMLVTGTIFGLAVGKGLRSAD